MSEEIKYEAVFGDQALFDGAPNDADLVGHAGGFYKNTSTGIVYCGGCTFTTDEYRNLGFVSMRRIIQESKRWTKADQEAGRLPEVGDIVRAIAIDEDACVAAINNDAVCVTFSGGEFITLHVSKIIPIETPEECAKRVREEWISEAFGHTAVFAQVSDGEKERLREHIRFIYDAHLSGELKMPEVQK